MKLRLATWNLWGDSRWHEREPSVERLLRSGVPDVLAAQELSDATAASVDRILPSHGRATPDLVGEPPLNIWFREDTLRHAGDGAAPIDDPGGERVALWVRLGIKNSRQTLVVFTTHLTWDDYPDPKVGAERRDRQLRRLASLVQSIHQVGEAAILMADLNDERSRFDPLDAIGLIDCHVRLGVPAEPTQPIPAYEPFQTTPRAVDKILTNALAVPLEVAVRRLSPTLPPPSDHWPVVATVRLDT